MTSVFWDAVEAYKAAQRPDPPPPNGRPALRVAPTDDRTRRYAATALERECDAVRSAAEGTRNDTLNIAAFNVGQLVGAGHLDYHEAADALHAAATATGLDDVEIGKTLRSGLAAGEKNPRQIPDREPEAPSWPVPTSVDATATPGEADGASGAEPNGDEDDPDDIVRRHLPIVDWHALWADESTEEWILEPLLPARRLIALYSAPKVGKSLLLLELAVAISRGEQVLGVTPDRPRRVLYVDFENDPKGDVRERLQAMGRHPDQLGDLCYLSYPTLAALDSETGGAMLLATVQAYRCEVVVVDTISRAIKGDENENDTWLDLYRHTGVALKRLGVAMIRLDHSGKDMDKGMRGGSAKYGDVDAVWRMTTVVDDKTYRLDCTDHRFALTEKTLVIHREVIPRLHHRVDAEGRSAAWRIKVEGVMELLDAVGLPRDAGAENARKAVRSSGLKASNQVIAEAVKRRRIPVPEAWGQVPSADLSPDSADRSRTGGVE